MRCDDQQLGEESKEEEEEEGKLVPDSPDFSVKYASHDSQEVVQVEKQNGSVATSEKAGTPLEEDDIESEKTREKKNKRESPPSRHPDGGYGWVIVFAAILQQVFSGPLLVMYGLLFGPKFEIFESSPTEIATVFSTYLIIWNLTTLFVGPLIELRSERFVACCGTLFTVGGLIFAAFSTTTVDMILAFGVVLGVGMGFSNANTIILLNKYFKRRVGAAFGILLTGLGLGGLAMPQVVKILLLNFEIQHTILIYAAICCLSFAGAALMRPVTKYLKPETKDSEEEATILTSGPIRGAEEDDTDPDKLKTDRAPAAQSQPAVEKNGSVASLAAAAAVEETTASGVGSEMAPKRQLCSCCLPAQKCLICRIFLMINWRLLLDLNFIVIALGNSVTFNCCLTYLSLISPISEERGLSVVDTANLMTIIGCTDVVSRFIHGFLGDLTCWGRFFQFPKKAIYTICGLCLAGAFIGLAFSHDFVSLLICVILISVLSAGMMINTAIIYSECFPTDLPSALGLSNLFRAGLAFVIGPLVGVIKEQGSNYSGSLFFLSACIAFCMILWILADHLPRNRSQSS